MLNKYEKQLYKKVIPELKSNDNLTLEGAEAIKYKPIFELMDAKGYIKIIEFDSFSGNGYVIHKYGNIDDFDKMLKAEEKQAKKLSRREWIIAIVSATVGGIIGLIPTVVSIFTK